MDIKFFKRIGRRIIRNFKGELVEVVTFICEVEEGDLIPRSDLVDVKWVKVDSFLTSICEESRMLLPEDVILHLKYYHNK